MKVKQLAAILLREPGWQDLEIEFIINDSKGFIGLGEVIKTETKGGDGRWLRLTLLCDCEVDT